MSKILIHNCITYFRGKDRGLWLFRSCMFSTAFKTKTRTKEVGRQVKTVEYNIVQIKN